MTTRVPFSMVADAPVNVRTYGAIGNGIANDHAAILAAASAAAGKELFFPAGIYLLATDTAIGIAAGTTVRGVGSATIIRKNSGTSDVFSVAANNVSIEELRIEGPENTGCDGIVFENCSLGRVSGVEGYKLASTVTVGPTTSCDRMIVERVFSDLNTQQGVHLNKATRTIIRDCFSRNIGTSSLHHGFYVGNCTGVQVVSCRGEGCAGSGLHIYSQGSYNGARISVIGGQYNSNGTSATSLRGGVVIACDVSSSWTDVLVDGVVARSNNGYNFCGSNLNQVDFKNCVANGNAKTTTNGFYIEQTRDGLSVNPSIYRNLSATISGCRSYSHGSGVRLVATAGTVDEVFIDGCIIHGNDAGVYATGATMDNFFIGSNNAFRANTTSGDLVGTFEALPGIKLADGTTAPATVAGVAQIYVDTADGDLKVKFGDGTVKTIVVDT